MLNLTKFKQEITAYKPLDRNYITYDKNRWVPAFENSRHLRDLSALHNKRISRKTIIKVYRDYYKHKILKPFTPFLLTMIWGYDSAGVGPFRVNRFMTPENEDLVRKALLQVKEHEIEKAFNTLMQIKGLKTSFVSKVLYFAARACRIAEYPLIFDIRVASNMISIYTHGKFDKMIRVQPTLDFTGYEEYNEMIHRLASKLGVAAEEVEFFIFKYSSERTRKTNNY